MTLNLSFATRPQKVNICFPCFVVGEATNRETVGLIGVVELWPDVGTVEAQVASVDTGVSAGGPEAAVRAAIVERASSAVHVASIR